ncbi:hypothetical protein KC19_4G087400 [Ceratodon purpureus]|uniref:Uncharacterized protein n=1 Tax=Ceratodon purpureus TaxID=3225 RepID=A0A8T0I9V9_CERPU|nr:hypothetical protein KC19_4G087400 [Ceratodon purpureus]KAG0579274.1 hypothetical protein KC19_4G087400 [Ceratodon purpureus]
MIKRLKITAVWIILHFLESAAAVIDLSWSPTASLDATTDTSQDKVIEWLKITAVPLGVILMGACIGGCIKSVLWRSLMRERREVSIAPEAHAPEARAPEALEMQPTEPPSNPGRDGSDLEEGIRMEGGAAGSA